jgi:hypothetical protein
VNPLQLDTLLRTRNGVIEGERGKKLCAKGKHHLVSAYPIPGDRCVRENCKHYTAHPKKP